MPKPLLSSVTRLEMRAMFRLLFTTWLLSSVDGRLSRRRPGLPLMSALRIDDANLGSRKNDDHMGAGTFDQLLDPLDPSAGTFSQRYMWDTTHWKGPGSPVILTTPGEAGIDDFSGYLTNLTLPGQYAQAMGGAVILFEHRFFGKSQPFEILDTEALQYLTMENAIGDLVNFAETVELPFDKAGKSHPSSAPWVFVGGSYSGSLAVWLGKYAPDTFWAYHASSAPVQAIYDYWAFFSPVEKGMPKNCSADIRRIADHVDEVINRGNDLEILNLQTLFGLEELKHTDDFASVLGLPLGNWQEIQLYEGYSTFFQMCDTVEGVRWVNATTGTEDELDIKPQPNVPLPGAEGVGLKAALHNFAKWFLYEGLPGSCNQYPYDEWADPLSVGCFDSYNESSPTYADWTETEYRPWVWMLCNEPYAFWQVGAPADQPSLVPRHVTADYMQRMCSLMFPPKGNFTYGSNRGKTVDDYNKKHGGWLYTNTSRLLWSNGEFDTWRPAGMSSEDRPGGMLQSTDEAPVYLMPGARHTNDLLWANGDANADVRQAQNLEIAQITKWVQEFVPSKRRQG